MDAVDWVIQRDIPGFPGYLAQSDGTVLSIWSRSRRPEIRFDRNHALVRRPHVSHGYCRVRLRAAGGAYVHRQLHTLIALAFHGEPEDPSHVVAHLDGDKRNCIPCNLRWMSHRENCAHKREHGTLLVGDDHPSTKMNVEACYTVLKRRDAGEESSVIAKDFGVSPDTIRHILRGQTVSSRVAREKYILDIDDPMWGIGMPTT